MQLKLIELELIQLMNRERGSDVNIVDLIQLINHVLS